MPIVGLSAAEVEDRKRRGLVNRTPNSAAREYCLIVLRNLFNWFNAMVVPAACALWYLGETQGALAVSGMAFVNTAISLAQEIRAKYHLDHLAILTESKARVRRDGQEIAISAGDVVQDDIILLKSGESIVADGPVVEAQFLEVDEALLTGESDAVKKPAGQKLMSGSYCVAGEGAYKAEKVGPESFAQKTSSQARRYSAMSSPLTRVVNLLIQCLSYTAIALCLLYTAFYFVEGFPKDLNQERAFVRQIAATITSMVPQGLVLTATLSFTLGALVMSRRGAMVQRLNAVETMAAIDVICTDKTGTLTTNQLLLDITEPLTDKGDDAKKFLAAFAYSSIDQDNKNLAAFRQAFKETKAERLDQIPFKSQNRYSAVRLRIESEEISLILGAPEALAEKTDQSSKVLELSQRWQKEGRRVLMLCQCDGAFVDGKLPDGTIQALLLIGLTDELRPEAGQVLQKLGEQGIAFKVISGDNPETVQGTVAHFDLPWAKDPVVTGKMLDEPGAERLILERSVFGRVAPEQKVTIVATLQQHGRYVAMIGDGVNDVLPIKKADLGIAMGAGSQASKTVAGLVLEKNNFALLPEALEEGRTIVRNLRRSGKLFLTKNVYALVLILAWATGVLSFFPFVPQQVTLLNWLVIGLPAFVIAISRERSPSATKPRFLREVGSFAIRTGVVFAIASIVISALNLGDSERGNRSILLSLLVVLGVTALFRALQDGEDKPLHGDVRFQFIGLAAVPLYLVAMYWPLSARFFELEPLTLQSWTVVGIVAIVAAAATWVLDHFVRFGR